MTRYPSSRLGGYASLVVAGLLAALVAGRPEPALLTIPFTVALVLGLSRPPSPLPRIVATLDRERVVEGDEAELLVRVASPAAGVQLRPMIPRGVAVVDTAVDATTASIRLTLRAGRWGVYDVGRIAVRVSDGFGMWWSEGSVPTGLRLRVHPTGERLDRVVASIDLQPFVGLHPSRARGDGFEFAELRPYAAGDRARAVNWRVSARRGALVVNDRHPDRTSEVVLLLDTFGVDRDDRLASLDAAIRAVAAVAAVYNRAHDRIALLTFGGHLRWLAPGSGRVQLVRIVDALLDTESLLTDTWEGVTRVPIGSLPPRSLLLAVTPLDSDTPVATLLDLRARGFDVAVIAVPSTTGAGRPGFDGDIASLGARIDDLVRDARRLRLERLGIAVGDASRAGGLAAAVAEVEAARRQTRRRIG